jgi:hypothetical protein
MSVTAVSPANGATGVCVDTPLTVTFSDAVSLGSLGSIQIFDAANPGTPVDTINAGDGLVQQRTFPGDGQSFSYPTIAINGHTVTINPHFNVFSSNTTYYVTIAPKTFLDAGGTNFAGLMDTNAWRFTTKTTGPADPNNIVVNGDGSADFLTVQGAVNSVPGGNTTPTIIQVRDGLYHEIVDIAGRNNLTIRGQSRAGTLIGFENNAGYQAANGGTTHARMAFKVNANDIAIENLTLTNMTPQGGGQAEALMIESGAQHCIINNADIASRQDTILANVNTSQGYFYNTTVSGNFDYIWGGGNLYFDNCIIHTISGSSGFNATAARTTTATDSSASYPWLNPGNTYTANGMSFVGCTFTADSGVSTATLAGGNGTAGNLVSWANCRFDAKYVTPSASLFNGNYLFWQYQNTDLSANPVSFSSLMTLPDGDPRLLAATNVNTWLYGWTPQLAPDILTNPVSRTVNAGNPAAFSVVATGIPDPTYQWLRNGTNLDGETNATLSLAGATAEDAGDYSVTVSTPAGSVTSRAATLTVVQPPPAPQMSEAVVSGGQFGFTFNGPAGMNYYVQASTNLDSTNWTTLLVTNSAALPLTFTDTNGLMPAQFYRVMAKP